MARVAVLAAVLLAGSAFAQEKKATVVKAASAYNPADSTGTKLISPNAKGVEIFVDGADKLAPLGPEVSNVQLTRYADPVWDKEFFGKNTFWMGLGHGGCGYGNLLDANKYPYMFGLSLSASARKALGFDGKDGVGCGACVRATCIDEYKPYCPKGATSAVGVVLDVCPDEPGHESGKACQELQADMYIKAWEFATGTSPSNPKVLLQRVMCPDPQTNIMMMVMTNNGPWQFLKFNLQNVGGTGIIKAVDMTCSDKTGKLKETVKLENAYGGVWQINNQPQYVDKCYLTLESEDHIKYTTATFDKLATGVVEDYPFVSIVDLGVQFPSGNSTMGAMAPGPSTVTSVSVAGRRLLSA